jgi:ATP phosphoribosyltransferase regulatory subunit
MVAESARRFAALEAQAQKIMTIFSDAGYEPVAPAIIQPADVFLDVIGENLRARTYVFNDPNGEELCLRPDLTVPTCRLHLERHSDPNQRAKYSYNGPCFRFQPTGGTAAHPREFRQAGIESFAASDRAKAEVETVALAIEALQAAGLEAFTLRIGDLGLFHAVIDAIDMPERWRRRLRHQFWRPEAFRQELKRLTSEPGAIARGLPGELLAAVDPDDRDKSVDMVERHIAEKGIEFIGARTLEEIADHLVEAAADLRAEPLPAQAASLIQGYLGVAAPCKAAGARLKDLVRDKGLDLADAIDAYRQRLELMTQAGIDVPHAEFSAEFGRNLEYYTGFVFEIVAPSLGPASPVAGGGRYDGLVRAVGSPRDVPAVGLAIHTERLLEAVSLGVEE